MIDSSKSNTFLKAPGEMAALMKAKDWSKTSVGDPDTWPQSLHTTLSIILHSKFPMFLFWGPEHICFYNDAYRPSLGNDGKHPAILGSKGEEFWKEIWQDIKPLIDNVLQGGEANWSEDQLLPIYRNGAMEDVYWTFSYSAVYDETEKPAGVFVTCNENTKKIHAIANLKESEDKLTFALEGGNLGYFDSYPQKQILNWSVKAKEFFGLAHNAKVDIDVYKSLIHPDDFVQAQTVLANALEGKSGEFYDNEYRTIHNRWLHVKGKIQFDKNGQAERITGVMQDITETKLATELLAASQHRFTDMIYSSPSLISILRGEDFIIDIANDAILEVWGKGKDIIGKPLLAVMPELIEQGLDKILEEVYKTGIPFRGYDMPVSLVRNGKTDILYFTFIYQAQRDINGVIDSVSIISTDVTKQAELNKKIFESERQIKETKDQLELTFANVPTAIFLYGKNKDLIFANERAAHLLGYNNVQELLAEKNYEVIMKKVSDIFHVMNEDEKLFGIEDLPTTVALESSTPTERIFSMKNKKSGIKKWLLNKSSPILDEDGSISMVLTTSTDITAQKLAEETIRNSEKRFRSLADEAPMWVWIADREINIQYANIELLHFIGLKHYTEFTGQVWQSSVHPDDISIVMDHFQNAVTKQKSFEFEARIQNASTENYEWFYVKAVPHMEEDIFTGFIGTAVNIQEKKVATEILEYRKALLESNNEASLDGALLVDTKGNIISYNKRFIEIWNMPLNITQAKNDTAALEYAMSQLLNPNQFIEKVKYLYDHPNETSKDELEFKDGKIVERYGYPVVGDDGTYYAWSWIFRDITQQKNDESIIKESEERFRNLVTSSPSAIAILKGKKLNIVVANDAIIKIWGKGKDVIGKPYFEVMPELIKQGYKEIFTEVYETGNPISDIETPINIFKNGVMQLRYYNFLLYAQKNIKGEIDGIVVIATEVTSKALANKIIQESEERFRLMAETLPQLIWVTNEKGNREYASGRWKEYTGINPQGEDAWKAIVEPSDIDAINAAWKHSLETGDIYKHEVRLKSKEGEYRWFGVRGEPVYNNENKIVKWVGAFTDIHTQKSFAQELKTQVENRTKELAALNISLLNKNESLSVSESFNRALTEISPNVVYIFDIEKNVPIFLNKTALEILGYTWEELNKVDSPLKTIIHPDDLTSVKLALYKMKTSTVGQVIEHEYRIKNKLGIWVPFLVRQIAFKRNNKNQVFQVLGIGVDITELKKSKNVLEQKNAELEKMNKELQSFAYISSHDLQEPLRKIQTFTNYIIDSEKNNLSQKGNDYFKRIQLSAARMRQLIDDLLAYSRASDTNTAFEEINLDTFIEEIKADFLDNINFKEATIDVNAGCNVMVIPFQFRQLVINLISNALKFKKEKVATHIIITSNTEKGTKRIDENMSEDKIYCHIKIKDNGIGFDPSYSKKIFEVFQRLHGKAEYEGTGIGLAIVKKIVDNHHGFIVATGEVGKGAEFNIYLPH